MKAERCEGPVRNDTSSPAPPLPHEPPGSLLVSQSDTQRALDDNRVTSDLIRSDTVFVKWSRHQIARLLAHARVATHAVGRPLFQAGEAADRLFFMLEGCVSLRIDGDEIDRLSIGSHEIATFPAWQEQIRAIRAASDSADVILITHHSLPHDPRHRRQHRTD